MLSYLWILVMVAVESLAREPVICDPVSYHDCKFTCQNVISPEKIPQRIREQACHLILINATLTGDWRLDLFDSLQLLEFRKSVVKSVSNKFLESLPSQAKIKLSISESIAPIGNHFLCSSQLLGLNITLFNNSVADANNLYCGNLDNLLIFDYIQLIWRVKLQCPWPCRCDVNMNVNFISKKNSNKLACNLDHSPNLVMNCSSSNMKKLPDNLPSGMHIILDMAHNQVHDLTPLVSKPMYQCVSMLNLLNNRVDNISILVKSDWWQNFRSLNLAGNLLKELDSRVFDARRFEKSHFSSNKWPMVALSRNPWSCSCKNIENLKVLLIKRGYEVIDKFSVRCGPVSNPSPPLLRLSTSGRQNWHNNDEGNEYVHILHSFIAIVLLGYACKLVKHVYVQYLRYVLLFLDPLPPLPAF